MTTSTQVKNLESKKRGVIQIVKLPE